MQIDYEHLEEKLSALRGLDFELTEAEELSAGNKAVEVFFTKSFQARLASKALNVNLYDIKELPINEYFKLTNEVSRFLFGGLGKTETQSSQSEKSQ